MSYNITTIKSRLVGFVMRRSNETPIHHGVNEQVSHESDLSLDPDNLCTRSC